jgi:chromosome transmission fidelity protein 18
MVLMMLTVTCRDLDALSTYETAGAHVLATQAPTRYAVRQVLDQELQKAIALRENDARQARFRAGNASGLHEDYVFDDKENARKGSGQKKTGAAVAAPVGIKRDFFGRVIAEKPLQETHANGGHRKKPIVDAGGKVWVTYHEGLNNAVRKPISLEEFLRGL